MKNLGIDVKQIDADQSYRHDTSLTVEESWALSQFLKRVSYSTCQRHATSVVETDAMMSALSKFQRAVNEAGYCPR